MYYYFKLYMFSKKMIVCCPENIDENIVFRIFTYLASRPTRHKLKKVEPFKQPQRKDDQRNGNSSHPLRRRWLGQRLINLVHDLSSLSLDLAPLTTAA